VEAPFRSISVGDGLSVPPISAVLDAIDYVHSEPPAVAGQGSAAA